MDKAKRIKSIFKKYLGGNVNINKMLETNDKEIEGDFVFILIKIFEEDVKIINAYIGEFLYYFHKKEFNSWVMGSDVLFVYLYKEDNKNNLAEIEKYFSKKKYEIKINIFYGLTKGIKYNIKYKDIFVPNMLLPKLINIQDMVNIEDIVIKQL